MQQQLQRVWQTLLQQVNGADMGGPWSQFGFDPGQTQPGLDAFSQWFNKGLYGLFGAPLQGWPFSGGVGSDRSASNAWFGMAPSEFVAMKDLPPLGLNRETELRWRELSEALKDQIDASNQLNRQLAGICTAALKRFQKSITNNEKDDIEITSLRGLYDLWIITAEQVYAEQVMTPGYSKAFGNCINSTARARKIWQELSDAAQASMNQPSRSELDSLIERQHALAAEVRALGERVLGDKDLAALHARIDALSQHVEGLTPAEQNKQSADDNSATAKKQPVHGPAKHKRGVAAKRPRKAKARPRAARSVHEFDIGNIRSETEPSPK